MLKAFDFGSNGVVKWRARSQPKGGRPSNCGATSRTDGGEGVTVLDATLQGSSGQALDESCSLEVEADQAFRLDRIPDQLLVHAFGFGYRRIGVKTIF